MNETMLVKGVAKCAYESTEECQAMECCYQCARYKAMVAKLAAYESTGLTPEGVAALRAQLERGRCENCLYRTALDSRAGLNGCYWHCAIGRGEETKNVWHKYSRHYKDYSLVDLEDFCSSFEPEPPREG